MENYIINKVIGDIAGIACIKLAITLGGDSDTLAAIAGLCLYKKMPDALVYQTLKKLQTG